MASTQSAKRKRIAAAASERVEYSRSEVTLLSILQARAAPVTVDEELLDAFYKRSGTNRPFNARQSMNVTINSLIRKVEINDERFRVRRSTRSGPIPTTVWIEKKA